MRSLDALGKCGKGLTAQGRGSSLEESMKAERDKRNTVQGRACRVNMEYLGKQEETRKESHYKVFCKVSADTLKCVGHILPPKCLYKWYTALATAFGLKQQACL